MGIEPTTSGLDLPSLCRLSYKVAQRKSGIFVVNKQRKHSRSFGLTGCCPWPLIGKVDIGKRMATIMNLTPCRVYSEVYRGFFPKAGPLSLSFHHLKGNWWHQSSTAVNINKFSYCTKSQFKYLQGPSDSDLNSRAVFFSGVDIRSISEHQFKISNGPVTIIQEPQKRRRDFIESDDEEQCWFRLNCEASVWDFPVTTSLSVIK